MCQEVVVFGVARHRPATGITAAFQRNAPCVRDGGIHALWLPKQRGGVVPGARAPKAAHGSLVCMCGDVGDGLGPPRSSVPMTASYPGTHDAPRFLDVVGFRAPCLGSTCAGCGWCNTIAGPPSTIGATCSSAFPYVLSGRSDIPPPSLLTLAPNTTDGKTWY